MSSKSNEISLQSQGESLLSSLSWMINRLPHWLRFMVFTRDDSTTLQHLQKFSPSILLDKRKEESQEDIRKYLIRKLDSKDVNGSLPQETIDFIVERAEGLFLYAEHIVNAIEEGRVDLDNLQSFPVGLEGFLRTFFKAQFTEVYYKVLLYSD